MLVQIVIHQICDQICLFIDKHFIPSSTHPVIIANMYMIVFHFVEWLSMRNSSFGVVWWKFLAIWSPGVERTKATLPLWASNENVDYLCLLCIDFYVWYAVSIFNHLPRMFLSTGLAFRITDWTCCHGTHLHAILRIISRGVSGLATDSPCGVWGRGWTTCLLHDSPLFGSHFKMRVGM